jgi:hypothetical protein
MELPHHCAPTVFTTIRASSASSCRCARRYGLTRDYRMTSDIKPGQRILGSCAARQNRRKFHSKKIRDNSPNASICRPPAPINDISIKGACLSCSHKTLILPQKWGCGNVAVSHRTFFDSGFRRPILDAHCCFAGRSFCFSCPEHSQPDLSREITPIWLQAGRPTH